jgi:hypothetical protein
MAQSAFQSKWGQLTPAAMGTLPEQYRAKVQAQMDAQKPKPESVTLKPDWTFAALDNLPQNVKDMLPQLQQWQPHVTIPQNVFAAVPSTQVQSWANTVAQQMNNNEASALARTQAYMKQKQAEAQAAAMAGYGGGGGGGGGGDDSLAWARLAQEKALADAQMAQQRRLAAQQLGESLANMQNQSWATALPWQLPKNTPWAPGTEPNGALAGLSSLAGIGYTPTRIYADPQPSMSQLLDWVSQATKKFG